MSIGYFLQYIDDGLPHLPVEGQKIARFGETCAARSRVSAGVFAREKSARQRAPDEDTDVVILGERLEFVFETPADKAVVHLRRYVFFQSQLILQHNRGGCLP